MVASSLGGGKVTESEIRAAVIPAALREDFEATREDGTRSYKGTLVEQYRQHQEYIRQKSELGS